ncbi:MAG: hypothetical protein LAT68_04915 [Cyclobacteriaceae bacterium]|nr:hypothetical protein [Cyclobacteriaceae bacterium]MCH8515653.1 hypothetical protein [Cyclobacteriaceae bacterium]
MRLLKFALPALLFSVFFMSCDSSSQDEVFFEKLSTYCGGTYIGKTTFPEEDDKKPLGPDQLTLIIQECSEDMISMPMIVGDTDKSRTWFLSREGGKLKFKHQHLGEDGEPDEISNYGGFSDSEGNALIQKFPADEETTGMIEDGRAREWRLAISEQDIFSYSLWIDGNRVFQADFNLAESINR